MKSDRKVVILHPYTGLYFSLAIYPIITGFNTLNIDKATRFVKDDEDQASFDRDRVLKHEYIEVFD